MAIQATAETVFGETRSLYIRLNNVEASNHGMPGQALFRGFLSKEAYLAEKHNVWERTIDFTPDVSQPIWPQAYAAIKAVLPGSVDM